MDGAPSLTAVLTIAAACFYVALRFAHQTFYGHLGLAPEDVGLGYAETLVRGAVLALWVVVVLAVCFFGVRALGRRERLNVLPALTIPRFALVVVVIFFIAGLPAMSIVARSQADQVRDGERLRPLAFANLGVRAERAHISWIGEPPQALKDVTRHRLMFLGEAGGSVVLYDVDAKRSLEIPSSNVAVSILP